MPTDALALDPDTRALLADRPRHLAALTLLSGGQHQRGPLADAQVDFGAEVAQLAYLVWLAYGLGRRGMLGGRPGYEAIQTLASRVRAAAGRAGSLAEFRVELLGRHGLDVGPEHMRQDDLLWWHRLCQAPDAASTWRRLRRPDRLQEVIEAAKLLITEGWLWETHPKRETTPTTEEG